ncbi:hypothetical protein GA0070606_4486 [Micromonospora citrea]|uniref:Uncharacterized protein n=1 Tax=Micromonospora citrea TaxID=47855 RepID=A0A1C6VLC1_9ACTN|nr:hypothetical protein [Micromonospora citrea]SCL67138.1 hypothetical protein GA0070606_4486 [Micromonospora citrea]
MPHDQPPGPPLRELPECPAPLPRAAWHRIIAEPEAVAGHLARAAVDEAGAVARDWVAGQRATFPGAPALTVAHGARAHLRHLLLYAGPVRVRSALTPADAVTAWSELAWYQALLVLHVAAALGADPQDPRRARDLLTLWRVRGDVPSPLDAPAPTEERLREVTPGLASTLGRLTGRRRRGVTAFAPDPSWGYVASDDARTLRPLADRAIRLYGSAPS